MTTRLYASCLADTLALCGVPDANAVEVARVKRYLNLAARRAYSESDYWPRWLTTEERIVSEDGLLPYSESGLSDIEVIRRIHATEPFAECGAAEYGSFVSRADGIQIAGYYSNLGDEDFTVSGDISIDLTETDTELDGKPVYSADGIYDPAPLSVVYYYAFWVEVDSVWIFQGSTDGVDFFQYNSSTATDTLPTTGWVEQTGTGSGVISVAPASGSAWVTYKAAFSVTYGDADGETADVPAEWADYMIYAAYAHFLRNEGQQEKAALEDQFAYSTYLVPQLERLDNQNGGHVFTRNLNHGNTQAR